MPGLYKQITDKYTRLEQEIYNKSSLVAVSHAIEDVVLNFELAARMFVFFQKEEFFLTEADRYRRLDRICEEIFLFADRFTPEAREGFSSDTRFCSIENFDHPNRKHLLEEWTVIVEHPRYPMALITQELPEKQKISRDSFRVFRGNLSFNPSVVEQAGKILQNILKQEEIISSCLPQIGGGEVKLSTAKMQKSDRMISLFLNNALNEIEDKVNMLANQNIMLNYSLSENEKRTREIVKRLCFAAEYKDEDTTRHLVRIGLISTLLYSQVEDNEKLFQRMYYASLMHDIGKIGIPDKILFKPGKLTDEEYEKIKEHPVIASHILRDSDHKLIRMARKIAYTHHERWDGQGYPEGLKGEEIPLEGRIVAIADVFDALISPRVYKEAYSLDKTISIMKEERNAHFDGDLLDIFMNNLDTILSYMEKIETEFLDRPEKEIAARYFRLHPNFSSLKGDYLPELEKLINDNYSGNQKQEMELYIRDYPSPPYI